VVSKPILCLDFDGVCHLYTSPWSDAATISDDAVPGLFEFLEAAAEHFTLHVFSSRSHQEGGIEAMQTWFEMQRWKQRPDGKPVELHFPLEKPPAKITLDDRALTFTGVWPSMSQLITFKPWNK
jgi:hypothetical protein